MFRRKQKIKVIDLFCGIGWLSHWLINQWFEVVAGIDFDNSCKFAFEKNNKSQFFSMDINDVSSSMLDNLYWNNNFKILVWCAPCQPFSLMNNQKSKYFNNKDVELRSPIRKYADLIKETQPDIISMENVAGLIDKKKYPSFAYFLEILEKEWYHTSYKIVDCIKYWIPQKRRRLVLLASKLWPIELIPETHQDNPITLREVIWNLEKIKAWEQSKTDPLHQAKNLNDINLKRIKAIPKNWGSLLDIKDKSLIPLCHTKQSGKSYIWNVYARMKWDEPAPTITTMCTWLWNWRFWHPEQNRAISLREASLIQTFPENYQFFDDSYNPWITKISKQIGNAVPVKLGEVIGESIKKHLKYYQS